jgi:ABC-type glycerol-3-phosphate transport system substrate-binding protein
MEQKKLSRRTFLLGMGSIAGASALAACVAPAAPSASTGAAAESTSAPAADSLIEIEYWHRQGGDTVLLLEELAAQFSEEHAGEISVTSIAQGDISELNQKIRAAAAGGGMPGATMADDYDVTQYVASNVLVALDDYIAHPEYGLTDEQIADILPNQLNRHKLDLYDNRTMAFTQGFSGFTSFWNVDATQKVGMERPPLLWSEFPDYARAISEANEGKPAWLISGAGDRFISTMLTSGTSWLKEGGEESNFDAPETLEVMTWWRELSDEGLLAVTGDARDLYMAYENLHYMDSSGNAARFNASLEGFTWNAGLPPQYADAPAPITEMYGPVNAIPVSDADKQLAGWRWISWLVITPEVHARMVNQTNYFPSTRSAVETTLLQETYAANPTFHKLVNEIAPAAQILSPSPALPQVRGEITANVVNEVLLGQLSPEEGVRKLKAEADAAIRNATL